MSTYNYNYQNLNSQIMLSYYKNVNDHTFDAMAVHEFNKLTLKSTYWGQLMNLCLVLFLLITLWVNIKQVQA